MEEKKYIRKYTHSFFVFMVLWGILFLCFSFYRSVGLQRVYPLFQSWLLIISRGSMGDPDALEELTAPAEYRYELIGDTRYRRGDTPGAIRAFSSALDIRDNSIIALKLALLSLEKKSEKKESESLSGSMKSGLEQSRARIETDTVNRGKYFGNSEKFMNQNPIFEVRDKEIIDW